MTFEFILLPPVFDFYICIRFQHPMLTIRAISVPSLQSKFNQKLSVRYIKLIKIAIKKYQNRIKLQL
jgi:hypothetical protein